MLKNKFLLKKSLILLTVVVWGLFSFASDVQAVGQVNIDKDTVILGESIHINVTGLPAQWVGFIYVDAAVDPIPMPSLPFTLAITQANGFSAAKQYDLQISVTDRGTNVPVPLQPDGGRQRITVTPGNANPPPGNGAQFPRIIDDSNLLTFFLRLLRLAMGVLGVLSVGMIVLGGFQMTLARGNDEAYGKGKKTVTWAVVGLVVALMSFSLIAIVQNVLKADIPDATLGQKLQVIKLSSSK
jgi:hypothetical protein